MIIACLATIESRAGILPIVVDSLKNQVDVLYIMANDYLIDEDFGKNVHTVKGDVKKGDAAKFIPYATFQGVRSLFKSNQDVTWFFCDDDLIYPGDYVKTGLKHLEKYPEAILSYHGRTIKDRPIESYYRKSRKEGYHCLHEVEGYHRVDPNGTLGTGVMFCNNSIEIQMKWFNYPNMADIYIAKFAIEQGVEMVVCPHSANWITYLNPKETIFETHQFNDENQTEIYNSISTSNF